jgi:cytochrome c553
LSHAQNDTPGATIAAKGSAGGAVACVSCHGAKGEGNAAAGFPRLAGLNAHYIEAQLDNFADGKRQNPVMAPIAKQLTASERKAVAAYYGALPTAKVVAVVDESALKTGDTGAWLAVRGRWDDNLPACVQCHAPGGVGVGTAFPALAGQPAAYLAAQLHAFKSGARPGGPLDLMTVIAKRLSDADVMAVANHFGGVPSPASPSESDRSKK